MTDARSSDGRRPGDAALVRNAADAQQVQRGGRLAQRRRDRELNDLRAVLATAEGRRAIWRLLEHCGVNRSSYDPSQRGDSTVFREGARNVGLFLMAEITDADEEALVTMMREARARAQSEALENVATRTPSASDKREDNDGRESV